MTLNVNIVRAVDHFLDQARDVLRHADIAPQTTLEPQDWPYLGWAFGVTRDQRAIKKPYQIDLDRNISFESMNRFWTAFSRFIRTQKVGTSFAERAIYFGLEYGSSSLLTNFRQFFIPADDQAPGQGRLEITQVLHVYPRKPIHPLIILHGQGENAKVNYASLADAYSAQHESPVLIAHLPGHGFSSPLPRSGSASQAHTRAVKAVLDEAVKRYPQAPLTVLANGLGASLFLQSVLREDISELLKSVGKIILTSPLLAFRGSRAMVCGLLSPSPPALLARAFDTLFPESFSYSVDDLTDLPDIRAQLMINSALGITSDLHPLGVDWAASVDETMRALSTARQHSYVKRGLNDQKVYLIASTDNPVSDGWVASHYFKRALPRARQLIIPTTHRVHASALGKDLVTEALNPGFAPGRAGFGLNSALVK